MKLTTYLVRGICLLLIMVTCNQVSYSQCDTNCELQCIGQINISLDQSCMTEITPAMGGNNIEPACNSAYSLKLYDEYGIVINGTVVGLEHNGQIITYEITENECGNKCWGKAKIEYKFPPQIDCPDDLTVACGVVDLLEYPTAVGGCAAFEVSLLSQEKDLFSCDPDFSSSIERTYQAKDEFGNTSLCSHTIFVERINIDDIIFPRDATISCSDSLLRFNEHGFPIPWYFHTLTGSGSTIGVPIVCDTTVMDGLYCSDSNDYSGVPLIPAGGATVITESDDPWDPGFIVESIDDSNNATLCNAVLTYTDLEIPNVPCKRKIIRTWDVREWWCTQEYTNGGLQIIAIVDDQAPTFVCPADNTITTDYECGGHVLLDPIEAYDECNSELNYLVQYNNGVLNTNGGYVDLNLGHNVLTYVVSDACYNQSSCQVNVTVTDNTEPIAICEQFKVVSISQSAQTIVYAEPFDNGSWDECGIDRFEVRRMDSLCVAADTLFGESVTFCCGDVNEEVMVAFRVYDWAGNYNDCMVTVDVQDKLAPEITCPIDQTIDCEQGYDINNLGLTFGEPTIVDNCSNTQIINEVVLADVSQCGVGNITRRFEILSEDSTVIVSCKQFITVNNTTIFNPDNIVWPLDYSVSDVCHSNDLDPQDLPEMHNYPTFPIQSTCTLLGYNHEDKVYRAPGGCLRIERYWTVINWCGNNEVGFDQYTSPLPQIIDILNMTAPEIAPADSLYFESINISCLGDTVEIERSAMDDCDFLSWTYAVRDSRDSIIFAGDTNYLNVLLPVGEFNIEWRVEDGCGNFDYDNQYVSLLNVKAPTPVCINGLSVNLVGMDLDSNGVVDAEMVELWASDFDSGSSHSCGNPIVLSFASDTTMKNRFFDCNDIGFVEVQMWATDVLTGYQDYCRAFLEVIDDNDFEICSDSLRTAGLNGDIYDENNRMIEGVEVILSNTSNVSMTDDSGRYAFENMPQGGTYEVMPLKDTDPLNGISTLDLVYIQRHILGVEEIKSPYKLIAADINKSDEVSAIDLIELRKLILGINEEIPTNLSWRFIDADHTFIDEYNPWATEIPETRFIPSLNMNEKVDFIGVKIGDVNNSVITSLHSEGIESRNSDVIRLEYELTTNEQHSIDIIDVYSHENISFDGCQGTIEFEPGMYDQLEVTSDFMDINEGHINFEKIQDGQIAFSFVSDYNMIIGQKEPLFSIKGFKASNSSESKDFSMTSRMVNQEFYSQGRTYKIELVERSSEMANNLQISPNPWSDYTQIEFEMKEGGETEWDFYSVTGQRLKHIKHQAIPGVNTLRLEKSMFKVQGLVYVKMLSNEGIKELKMIIL